MLATEELERDSTATLASVYTFLGLPRPTAPLAAEEPQARYCVNGKHGVMDEAANRNWRAGRLDGQSDEDGDGGGIGKCPSAEDEKSVGADGVSRYKMDGGTEGLLKQFFAPYNARLFALLGRNLPWAA